MAPAAAELFELARSYLARQSWYWKATESAASTDLELADCSIVRVGDPGLARLVLAGGGRLYQLFVGWRPSRGITGALRDEQGALFGAALDGTTQVVVYDALADDELCRAILDVASAGAEQATLVRPVNSLVSHASLVFDERLFMKCYRVLERDARPEVEVMFRLDEVGFNAMIAPVARWREDGVDIALVREFLPSALEGRLLALTSLRDLLGHAAAEEGAFSSIGGLGDPDRAAAATGGDFAAEIARLGQMTARMHLALATAFGTRFVSTEDFDPALFEEEIGARIVRPAAGGYGRAVRLHGDYHLRRVMRTESGWVVAGFADDPLYASGSEDPSLPGRVGSPLEDLADMGFALGQIVEEGLAHYRSVEHLANELADAWWRRNRRAFLDGYHGVAGITDLLPPNPETEEALLSSLEALRARRYEATPSDE